MAAQKNTHQRYMPVVQEEDCEDVDRMVHRHGFNSSREDTSRGSYHPPVPVLRVHTVLLNNQDELTIEIYSLEEDPIFDLYRWAIENRIDDLALLQVLRKRIYREICRIRGIRMPRVAPAQTVAATTTPVPPLKPTVSLTKPTPPAQKKVGNTVSSKQLGNILGAGKSGGTVSTSASLNHGTLSSLLSGRRKSTNAVSVLSTHNSHSKSTAQQSSALKPQTENPPAIQPSPMFKQPSFNDLPQDTLFGATNSMARQSPPPTAINPHRADLFSSPQTSTIPAPPPTGIKQAPSSPSAQRLREITYTLVPSKNNQDNIGGNTSAGVGVNTASGNIGGGKSGGGQISSEQTLQKIFSLLDSDQDGRISQDSMDLDGIVRISEDLLDQFQEVLTHIMETGADLDYPSFRDIAKEKANLDKIRDIYWNCTKG